MDRLDHPREQGNGGSGGRLQAGDTWVWLDMHGAGGECMVEHSQHLIGGEKIPGMPPSNGLMDQSCRIVTRLAGRDPAKQATWLKNAVHFL
jgi:hypothetical protein